MVSSSMMGTGLKCLLKAECLSIVESDAEQGIVSV